MRASRIPKRARVLGGRGGRGTAGPGSDFIGTGLDQEMEILISQRTAGCGNGSGPRPTSLAEISTRLGLRNSQLLQKLLKGKAKVYMKLYASKSNRGGFLCESDLTDSADAPLGLHLSAPSARALTPARGKQRAPHPSLQPPALSPCFTFEAYFKPSVWKQLLLLVTAKHGLYSLQLPRPKPIHPAFSLSPCSGPSSPSPRGRDGPGPAVPRVRPGPATLLRTRPLRSPHL